MITVAQLLAMPVGERIGGGFLMTIKTIKKSTQLPNGKYVHTVVLFDNTGEMLADIKDPKGYIPPIRGSQLLVVVAIIQAAEKGTKLYIDQFDMPAGKSEPDYYAGGDNIPDWETITRGKIRHGIICSMIRAGSNMHDILVKDKKEIESLVEYIFTGEQQ